jgi:hypothetical protein
MPTRKAGHELRELRETDGVAGNKKQPRRENCEERTCCFFAVFAQFVVSLSFTCLVVVVFA